MSALVWFLGPLFLDCTSGAMYNFVPTSAAWLVKVSESGINEWLPRVMSASGVTKTGETSEGSTAARLEVARPKSPTVQA